MRGEGDRRHPTSPPPPRKRKTLARGRASPSRERGSLSGQASSVRPSAPMAIGRPMPRRFPGYCAAAARHALCHRISTLVRLRGAAWYRGMGARQPRDAWSARCSISPTRRSCCWPWPCRRSSGGGCGSAGGALRYPATGALAGLPAGRGRWARYGGAGLRGLALLLLVVALAGPRWPDRRTRIDTEGIAIQMVVDVSGSMAEPDFDWDGPVAAPGRGQAGLPPVRGRRRRRRDALRGTRQRPHRPGHLRHPAGKPLPADAQPFGAVEDARRGAAALRPGRNRRRTSATPWCWPCTGWSRPGRAARCWCCSATASTTSTRRRPG